MGKNGSFNCFERLRKSCDEGQLNEALEIVGTLFQEGKFISTIIFSRLLQKCIDKEDVAVGRAVHRLIVKSGFESDTFLGSYLIRMFAVDGSLPEASQVFSKLANPNVFSWSAIISAHSKLGHFEQAIKLYHQMYNTNVTADGHVYLAVLKACAGIPSLAQGKLIHSHVIESGLDLDIFVSNSLIDMYAKSGSLKDANDVFDGLPKQDVVTWNAMIAGFVQHGNDKEALVLFQQMQERGMKPTRITFLWILKSCSCPGEGKLIHFGIIEHGYELDLEVSNTMIGMYAKCGSLDDARRLFDRLCKRSIVTWNAMISGLAQHGHGQVAFQYFQKMQQEGLEPDRVTAVCMLKACSSMTALPIGKLIHVHIICIGLDLHISVGNTLIDMYAKCEWLDDAFRVFITLPKKDIVTWNVMIAGFSQPSHAHKALQLFQQMQQEGMGPTGITFASVLTACSSLAALYHGKLIHVHVIESDIEWDAHVSNTMIDMYTKCGNLHDACKVFDKCSKQNLVTLNTMLAGYIQHDHGQNAFQLFQCMQHVGLEPDRVTFICIMKACSMMFSLNQGKLVHSHIIRNIFEMDVSIGNTLIDMYANCGSIEDACRVFERMPKRSVVTWSVMMSCYAHRDYNLVLKLFEDMKQEGIKPDNVSYACLLSACSHMGEVKGGYYHFNSMTEDHEITPTQEHYNYMVDLLGRVGHLNEAQVRLETMPFQPNILGWISLLGHCRTHGNVKLARTCFNHILSIDDGNAVGYMLLSNIYVHAGMWENADKINKQRKCESAWKIPGKACIQVQCKVHNFTVGDMSHDQSKEVSSKLKRLHMQMEEEGYMPFLV